MLVESRLEAAALSRFWRRHGLSVAALTMVWAVVSFLPPLLMGWAHFSLFGMPLAMWFMAELAPLAFVVIAWSYARRADALDADYAATER